MTCRKLAALCCIFVAGAAGGNNLSEPAGWLPGDILAAHNEIRSRLDLPPLRWSDRLAAHAQEWADRLLRENSFHHRSHPVFGENLFEITGGRATSKRVVGDWASEVRDYDYRANTCRAVCGHYTQVVWSNTREVGCAVARDASREVWVCNYNPPGNWIGERPY